MYLLLLAPLAISFIFKFKSQFLYLLKLLDLPFAIFSMLGPNLIKLLDLPLVIFSMLGPNSIKLLDLLLVICSMLGPKLCGDCYISSRDKSVFVLFCVFYRSKSRQRVSDLARSQRSSLVGMHNLFGSKSRQ